jgi:NAD(P)H-flavin reductase/hemoglobin-like flavoprotein
VDVERLKASFARVAGNGDQVPQYFYSYLFLTHPALRELFPVAMSAQRDKLVTALGRIVSGVDELDRVAPFVRSLGRDHRKFGVVADHYPQVGDALLATLAYFAADDWTPELAADWREAYATVAQVMTAAAEQAADTGPPWWDAEVVAHDRRPGTSVAVITARPHTRLDYVPGQSVGVESQLRPRVWRFYSPANAPRPDGSIELHVRADLNGHLSPALVHALRVGDMLRLGAPIGKRLTLDSDSDRDLLLLAGGTGLAPLKALVEQVAAEAAEGNAPRRVTLVCGARTGVDLYDQKALAHLGDAYPWLTVLSAVSDDARHGGERGTAVDLALRAGRWVDHDTYVCGSAAMVAGTLSRLTAAGVPAERIHTEDSDPHGYNPSPAPRPAPVAAGSESPR